DTGGDTGGDSGGDSSGDDSSGTPAELEGYTGTFYVTGAAQATANYDDDKPDASYSNLCWAYAFASQITWYLDQYEASGKTVSNSEPRTIAAIVEVLKGRVGNNPGDLSEGISEYITNSGKLSGIADYTWSPMTPTAYTHYYPNSEPEVFNSIEGFSKHLFENLYKGPAFVQLLSTASSGHAVTIWGAEFEKGKVKAIYIADSDDNKKTYQRHEIELDSKGRVCIKGYWAPKINALTHLWLPSGVTPVPPMIETPDPEPVAPTELYATIEADVLFSAIAWTNEAGETYDATEIDWTQVTALTFTPSGNHQVYVDQSLAVVTLMTVTGPGEISLALTFGGSAAPSGTLAIAKDATVTCAGLYAANANLSITGMGTCLFSHSGEFTGTITTEAGITFQTGMDMTLTADNRFNGPVEVTSGTLKLNATAIVAGGLTIQNKGSLAGTGAIDGDVTFNEGATLDITQGALTVEGQVTGTATVNGLGPILKGDALNATNFQATGDSMLVSTKEGLVHTKRPSLKKDGVESVSDGAATIIAQKAAAAGLYDFTLDASSADPAGAELFDHVVKVTQQARSGSSGVVKVEYDFGIQAMTIQFLTTAEKVSADGLYLVVTAVVDNGDDTTPAAYTTGTEVQLLLNGAVLNDTTVIESATGRVKIAVSYATFTLAKGEANAAHEFTVKAVNTP
ncbi:MAG: IdeS/Mac family cysteine endopeptidase, partial [bacterium]|nr:IdeS/Mac family cysteine endopeptidase [bacterium]